MIREWGRIETPIYLTSTHAVGRVYDGAIEVAVVSDPLVGTEEFVIPVVGECDDSWLSEGRIVQVEAADVARAVADCGWRLRRRRRGRRGDGDDDQGLQGRNRHGQPDRTVDRGAVGVLVLSNFSPPPGLVMDGVPVGDLLGSAAAGRAHEGGELHRGRRGRCAVVRPPARARRAASRPGLARCGSVGHHGSGEIFVAFAPPGRRPRGEAPAAPCQTST